VPPYLQLAVYVYVREQEWNEKEPVCFILDHSSCTATHCSTLQRTATHCNTLLHTATHCNTLLHTATHCNTLQHTATHCNTLLHTATHCYTVQHTATPICHTKLNLHKRVQFNLVYVYTRLNPYRRVIAH